MAVGKSKSSGKGGKKGGLKKKAVDMMTRKEWYDVVAPSIFTKRQCCKTLVNKTIGTKIAAENLKGRQYEVSLGDLNAEGDESQAFRKVHMWMADCQLVAQHV